MQASWRFRGGHADPVVGEFGMEHHSLLRHMAGYAVGGGGWTDSGLRPHAIGMTADARPVPLGPLCSEVRVRIVAGGAFKAFRRFVITMAQNQTLAWKSGCIGSSLDELNRRQVRVPRRTAMAGATHLDLGEGIQPARIGNFTVLVPGRSVRPRRQEAMFQTRSMASLAMNAHLGHCGSGLARGVGGGVAGKALLRLLQGQRTAQALEGCLRIASGGASRQRVGPFRGVPAQAAS
jgi:hypothetical protein